MMKAAIVTGSGAPLGYGCDRIMFRRAAFLLVVAASVLAGRAAVAESRFEKEIRPLLSRYCFDCHGKTRQKADLSLEAYRDTTAARKDHTVWEKVRHHIRSREMPPEDNPQPTEAERNLIVRWIETDLFPLDCSKPDPGRVTLRRLNRAEYSNTIRDLVGVDFRAGENFPPDDSGYGFDNIGDVLSLSPPLLEKYLLAAEQILDQAIVTDRKPALPRQSFPAAQFKITGGGALDGCCVNLFSVGEVSVPCSIAATGEYVLRVTAYGQQAGPEPARMGLKVDGREIQTLDVKETESAPGRFETRLKLAAGSHRLSAAFLNDYFNPDDPNPRRRDRNLVVQSIELEGPLDAPPPPLPETHRRIFICQPKATAPGDCARRTIESFARRAFRRPVAAKELDRLVTLFDRASRAGESFERAIQITLQAVLISPHFLFRGELQPEPDNPRVTHKIDEFGLASRLSYFLWSSMPDDELFALAEKGRLRKDLAAQVRRMVRDPKSRAFVENFAGQWLQLRNLELVQPDSREFPAFNRDLRAAMARETELFFEHVLREDRSVMEFIDADYSFVNDRLARHYGLKGVKGPEFRRVSLAGTPRGGVITHASVLTITSNPTRTSPVKRGKWVLENLLAEPPPPAPPDVPPLREGKSAAASASLRQRMEQHRDNPACSSCHELMDPIGFGLENFDAVGAWREKEGRFPIDASGRLASGETFLGAAQLRAILATQKRQAFARCLVEKVLTYALGRGLEYYDRCAVDQILRELERHDYRFSALLLGVADSVPFQMRRGEGERL